MPDYSFPQWLIPRSEPWQAFVAGANAGHGLGANRIRSAESVQRGYEYETTLQEKQREFDRELELRAQDLAQRREHQALQDRISTTQFINDVNDMQALQSWYPQFSSAKGEDLMRLQPPNVNNTMVRERLATELRMRQKQEATSEIAGFLSNPDVKLYEPKWQSEYFKLRQKWGIFGADSPDSMLAPIRAAETVHRLEQKANAGTVSEQNAAAITELQGLADAARAVGDEQTAQEYEKQAEYIQHRPANTSSLNQERLLIEAKISDAEKQINDIKLSGDKAKAKDAAIAPIQTQLTEYRRQLHALGSPALPQVGEVKKGYRFKGGDPSKQENWEKVQ